MFQLQLQFGQSQLETLQTVIYIELRKKGTDVDIKNVDN